jgi:hypothetical protein
MFQLANAVVMALNKGLDNAAVFVARRPRDRPRQAALASADIDGYSSRNRHRRARLAQIRDLIAEASWRISKNVGRCQDTPSPFRPLEPALKSPESAEAAVARSSRSSLSTLHARCVSLHRDGVLHQTSLCFTNLPDTLLEPSRENEQPAVIVRRRAESRIEVECALQDSFCVIKCRR